MTYPLWGRENVIDRVVDEAVGAGTAGLIEVVAHPKASRGRFVQAVAAALQAAGVAVEERTAGELSGLRPGELAGDLEAGNGARRVLVLRNGEWADPVSLGMIAAGLTRDPSLTVVIDRPDLSAGGHRSFDRLGELAEDIGAFTRLRLDGPTVEDLAAGLDLDHDAAVALHRAAGGDDDALADLLTDLHAEGPGELGAMLSDLARLGSPLGTLEDPDRQLAEILLVAEHPVRTPVLATAVGHDERDVLDAIERLSAAGIAVDTPAGIEAGSGGRADAARRSLAPSRAAAAARALANALAADDSYDDDARLGRYYELGGDWQAAFERFHAAIERTEGEAAGAAIDQALRALSAGAATDDATRGRLLLARAQQLSDAAFSDLALADLRGAVGLLDGEARVDALGFLAAVLDNHQLPQESEVAIALAEWEAHQLDAPEKLGSLLTLRARTAARLGFANEADSLLEHGTALVSAHGTPRQQHNARNNRAWMAFDRGEATKAEQLFAELLDSAGDAISTVQARAWHGRALALRGRAAAAQAAFDAVAELRGQPSATAAQFLAAIGEQELALRTGRPDAALRANDTERALVTLLLPAWENGTHHRRAAALAMLDRLEEAAAEVAAAITRSPGGASGDRWRLRSTALRMDIAERRTGSWDKKAAEDLTDLLLVSGWYGAAVELMITRARVDRDAEVGREAARLAMSMGDPIAAAAALEAAGSWDGGEAIARAVQDLANEVPAEWHDAWRAMPGISSAMAVDVTADAEEPDWHADLRNWLDESDLTERRLSPAQRQTGGLVRRSGERRRFGLTALASAMAAAVTTVVVLGVLGVIPPDATTPTTTAAPPTTTATTEADAGTTNTTSTTLGPIEERLQPLPTDGLFGVAPYFGGPSHNNIREIAGIREFTGYYWEYTDIGVVFSQPVVQGKLLYVGDRNGIIHVIDLDRGTASRTFPMDDDIEAPLAVARLALGEGGAEITRGFAVDKSGNVKMFDAQRLNPDGFELGETTTAGPIIVGSGADTRVVLATWEGRVRSLDVDLNEQVAMYPPADQESLGSIEHTPAVFDGRLYVADSDGMLTVLDAITLEFVCEADLREPASAAPVVADDLVWVPATNALVIRQLDCFPPPLEDRQQIPMIAITSPVVTTPHAYITDGANIYKEDLTSQANPLDRQSSADWSELAEVAIQSSPVLANDVVYHGDNRTLVARDAGSGEVLAEFVVGSRISLPVIVIDNAIIVTVNGRIIAVAGT